MRVTSFYDCKVHSFGYNPAKGDYGHVIVTEQTIKNTTVYALYGHLSPASVQFTWAGKLVKKGDLLGYLGASDFNGGWPPHLHFQLSLERPKTHDMPGVVSGEDHQRARAQFPDPRLVLGMLYEGEGPFFAEKL
eukprot:CAMPEP_0173384942 /NCGR_PEP_ID=MMETSP1356-20130122/7530_1 /TAXON_ID=77927 ORGANISM="Hemiselmis virescens, Strain PCC157" /NCGR_SAMPLE_ID=MMETSP1356 /ASSEMBLY_ACC=CAM_ASM_000847 /LENGTH=133 /DNA_ID=CAMNT_0014340537 /DNA_START=169 /DNA_END=570 /DNA_ORIENTATION=+